MDLNLLITNHKQIGKQVYVFNGYSKVIKIYSAFELAKAYFCMSNDVFFNQYGFNFVPPGTLWEDAKRAVGKM